LPLLGDVPHRRRRGASHPAPRRHERGHCYFSDRLLGEGFIMKRALTIAGSDSGGGAGIQADLKTFAAFGVYGTSAITAVTAQNTLAVTRIQPIDPRVVAAQIEAVAADIGVDAAKTGMLAEAPIIEAVAAAVRATHLPHLVVDPVMVSKSGALLLRDDAIATLVAWLLPMAEVVTPNLPEAERLSGRSVATPAQRREAARRIGALGPRIVVVKGGHDRGGAEIVDLVFDGAHFEEIRGPRVATRGTHGTGCTFSAAITAGLALGRPTFEAIVNARDYLTAALRSAPDIGKGAGPVDHFHAFRSGRGTPGA
jgi:hydroxymethylpyrimidine/phosphomethylpyrimidine kinase